MSYTTPFTAVAGTAWKASDWNTYGRDDIAWLATDSPSCRAYNDAAVSVANASGVAFITLNSERFDNAAMHSTSSNTSRITVPTGGGGKFIVGGAIQFAASGLGTLRGMHIMVNRTSDIVWDTRPPSTSNTPAVSACAVYALSAADYVEMGAYQDSGGALNVNVAANYSPEFWALWFRN